MRALQPVVGQQSYPVPVEWVMEKGGKYGPWVTSQSRQGEGDATVARPVSETEFPRWQVTRTEPSVVDDIERLMHRLRWCAEVRGEPAVRELLYRNPETLGLLADALECVWTFFGPRQKVALEVASDPEGMEPPCLFVYVVVKSEEMAKATALLQGIDRVWILPKLPQIINRICIDLEFEKG